MANVSRYLFALGAVIAFLTSCSASPSVTPQPLGLRAFHDVTSDYSRERVLHKFCSQSGCSDGAFPSAITIGPDGSLFGTTREGGDYGVVFQVQRSQSGYTERVLHSFTNNPDGAGPSGGVTPDATGALYGATGGGGSAGDGTIYKLTPNGSGYMERVIYSFSGRSDGAYPGGGVVIDKDGVIYGTTLTGGKGSTPSGTVFKLTRSGLKYKKTTIYTFKGGYDGSEPSGNLVLDRAGALYGTTVFAGGSCREYSGGCGIVYKLAPKRSHYVETVLYRFKGPPDAASPTAGLTADGIGALYGTSGGGGEAWEGAVFKVVPSRSGSSESVLYSFEYRCGSGHPSGAFVNGGVVVSAKGVIYGTTASGCIGSYRNGGTVFKLTPPGSGQIGAGARVTYLYSFCTQGYSSGCPDGANPDDVIFGSDGALYGTTTHGGFGPCHTNSSPFGCGMVFKLNER